MSFDYERFVAACKSGLDSMTPEEVLALVEKYSDSEPDLDAAWAWFREQASFELLEEETGEWSVLCAYGEAWFVGDTRDGAVLAAWRAAKQNNEKGEG